MDAACQRLVRAAGADGKSSAAVGGRREALEVTGTRVLTFFSSSGMPFQTAEILRRMSWYGVSGASSRNFVRTEFWNSR